MHDLSSAYAALLYCAHVVALAGLAGLWMEGPR